MDPGWCPREEIFSVGLIAFRVVGSSAINIMKYIYILFIAKWEWVVIGFSITNNHLRDLLSQALSCKNLEVQMRLTVYARV